MELEDPKCIIQDKVDGFRAKADSESLLVFNSDRQTCPPVSEIDAIESDLPDQSVGLDNPSMVVVE